LSVVAPLSASYPALTVGISVFTGEHLTAMRAAGIMLILIGVIVVVWGEAESQSVAPASQSILKKKPESGIGAAMIAAVGFGVLFWLLGNRVVPRVGFASTVWMIRLTSSALTALVVLAMKQPISLPRNDTVSLWLLAMGVLDTGAFVLNNRGMQLEQVSVVSVLASLYGAVTVLLSTVVLREKMSRWQLLGIVAIFAGIALVSR
jgi:drug/metabolite transporter (DMT)-like permease